MPGKSGTPEHDELLSPVELDAARRARMRRKVLASLDQRGPTFADGVYNGLVLLGRPGPILLRVAAVALIVASVGAAAGVAAADSLPDEPLYSVKLATENARLAFASTPEDRATVELSIAEHRLTEASRLAEAGREGAALEASSAYGSHLATAAAELATIVSSRRTDALIGQLETRLDAQRQQVAVTAARLANDPRTASAASVLATVTATNAPGDGVTTAAARIAANAAAFSERAAVVAEARWKSALTPSPRSASATPRPTATSTVRPASVTEAPRPTGTATARPTSTSTSVPTRTPTGPAATSTPTTAPATRTPTSSAGVTSSTARPSPRQATPTINPSAARLAAERARAGAELAKKKAEAAKKSATPKPSRTATPTPTRK